MSVYSPWNRKDGGILISFGTSTFLPLLPPKTEIVFPCTFSAEIMQKKP